MKFGKWLYLLLIPPGVALFLFLFGIGYLIVESFQLDNGWGAANYVDFFMRRDYVDMLLRTIITSGWVTFFSILVGYPIAYIISRYKGNRNTLMLLVITPWLVSVVVRTYGWVVVLGVQGTLNSMLVWLGVVDAPVRMIFNTVGVVIGLVHVLCPFMIVSVLTSLLYQNRSLEEASMILGARPVKTFLNVTLPLSSPGLITGIILVFLMSTGAIVTPLLLGGVRDGMLATQIYLGILQMFDLPKASAMALILVASVLCIVLPLQLFEKWLSRRIYGDGQVS